MTDDELNELMSRAGSSYRTDAEPPLERIWAVVEARAFGPRPVRLGARPLWPRFLALAATLLVGIGLGLFAERWFDARRVSATRSMAPAGGPVVNASLPSLAPSPFVGLARDYFQQTTALVVALAGDLRTGHVLPSTVTRARDLLSTTRLLLDGHPPDPALRDLLQDLELVLAQVVRLPETRQPGEDAQLIADAMDERGVLSRLAVIVSDRQIAP